MIDPYARFTPDRPLVLGTRGSPLALRQTEAVRAGLAESWPGLPVEVATIKVSGDAVTDRPLAEIGGKGLFTKELDRALAEGRCTAAVHSMKDMETQIDPRTAIGAVLPRADPRDAWLSPHADTPAGLPGGARVGTASVRRQAQLLAARPDLEVVLFRGNVQTRLRKLADGVADATMLAMAGLERLGMVAESGAVALAPETFLPAVAQGAIAVAAGVDDADARAVLSALDDTPSRRRTTCERAFLAELDGSCQTPIAGLAEIDRDGRLSFRGLVAREDGTCLLRVAESGDAADAEAIGAEAGRRLRAEMGDDFFA